MANDTQTVILALTPDYYGGGRSPAETLEDWLAGVEYEVYGPAGLREG